MAVNVRITGNYALKLKGAMPVISIDTLPAGKRLYVFDRSRNIQVDNPLAVNAQEGWVDCLSGGVRIRLHGDYEVHITDKPSPKPPMPTRKLLRRGRY